MQARGNIRRQNLESRATSRLTPLLFRKKGREALAEVAGDLDYCRLLDDAREAVR